MGEQQDRAICIAGHCVRPAGPEAGEEREDTGKDQGRDGAECAGAFDPGE